MTILSRMADRIDAVLYWTRWPTAAVSLVILWPTTAECFQVLADCVATPGPMLPFVVGAILYVLIWIWVVRWWGTTLLSTLEHELTHAVFALLTFHRITSLKTSWSNGGQMTFSGRGNWIISLAPYFFPTLCCGLVVVSAPFSVNHHVLGALAGIAFSYHVTSTIRETHAGQSDLRKEGWLFCGAILPTANLLANGLVIVYVRGATAGVFDFFLHIGQRTRDLLW